MKALGKRWIIGLAVGVLAASGAIQVVGIRDVKNGDRAMAVQPVGLGARVPQALAGWTVRDEPLGPNEAVQDAVAKNLNYDDYVYRVYERGGTRIGVYVAYWAPGRMPVSKVASHTPDRCWVENGWICDAARFGETVDVVGAPALALGQGREFLSPRGDREHVLYWHLVGSKLYDYGDRVNTGPDPVKWWRDTMAYAFSGSDAQYFIRLTSNRPIESLRDHPGFAEIVKAIGELGLEAPAH